MKQKFLNARYISFFVLGLFIVIVIAVLFTIADRHQQKSEIKKAVEMLNKKNTLIEQIETTLEILFLAENDFKSYTLNYDIYFLQEYREKIKLLVENIDSLQQMIHPDIRETADSKASEIIQEKNEEAKEVVKLKMLIDSLLAASSGENVQLYQYSSQFPIVKKFSLEERGIEIDTINQVKTTTQETKGVLGKIKNFFVGEKKEEQASMEIIVKKGEVEQQIDSTFIQETEGVVTTVIEESNKYYQEQFRLLFLKQTELRRKEIKLLQLNNSLMQEIKTLLSKIKTDVISEEDFLKKHSSNIVLRSVDRLHALFLISIIFALCMALGLFLVFRKLYTYQQELIASKLKIEKQVIEKDRFLAFISHELRSPLSSIIGFSRQLNKTGVSSEQSKYISGILSSSEIMQTSVNDILDLSKFQAGKMNFISEPFQPYFVLKQAIDSFKVMAVDKNISLKYNAEKENISLVGDEVRLLQIANNLLSNALKYTQEGTVSLNLLLEKVSESACIMKIQVKDTGIGIESSKIHEIFNEYSRVHSENEHKWISGVGLGLSLTRILVEKMEGTIEVESVVSKGSMFTVTIPYMIGAPVKGKYPDKRIMAFLHGKRILIADDNDFNLSLLKSIFQEVGADYQTAENGEEAFRKLIEGDFEILITDMHMPLMDGLTLVKHIRNYSEEKLRKLPVIMLTGSISSDSVGQIIEAGVNAYLPKPFKQEELFNAIYECISRNKD